jgi:hypothetical protein
MSADVGELVDICRDFIREHRITHPETIYQSDRVIEHAYELIENICNVVGYADLGEEDCE